MSRMRQKGLPAGTERHLRFEHDYGLQKARKMAAAIDVDATLNRLEQEVMQHVALLYQLKKKAEELKEAYREGVIGEALYERMITQKGQELTAASRYLQRLESSCWSAWGAHRYFRPWREHGNRGSGRRFGIRLID